MAERKGQKQENRLESEVSLTFQAGKAFGSGFHPSTQAALMAMDLLKSQKFGQILDMGCGSGVLSLVAASWWPHASILAVDIDEGAIITTLQNARDNGFSDHIRGIRSDGFSEASVHESGSYDLMLCNVLPEPLMRMAGDVATYLAPGGKVILSGILQWLLPQVLDGYCAVGLTTVQEICVAEWRAVILERS